MSISLPWNVKITFWYSLVFHLADAISGMVISNYFYDLTGKNLFVGISEGLQGFAQMIVSLPIGFLSDKLSKVKIIKYCVVIKFIVILLTTIPLSLDFVTNKESKTTNNIIYILITISCAFWGISLGSNGVIDALFANSLKDGVQRMKYTSYRYIIEVLASSVGPLISLFLFFCLGNSWSRSTMIIIWLTSLGVFMLSLILLLMYREQEFEHQVSESPNQSSISIEKSESPYQLPTSAKTSESPYQLPNSIKKLESLNQLSTSAKTSELPSQLPNSIKKPESPNQLPNSIEKPESPNPRKIRNNEETEELSNSPTPPKLQVEGPVGVLKESLNSDIELLSSLDLKLSISPDQELSVSPDQKELPNNKINNTTWWIPYICLISNTIFALGSGLIVKFWPIFYQNEVKMTPSEVSLTYFIQSIVCALSIQALSYTIKKLSFPSFIGQLGWSLITMVCSLISLTALIMAITLRDNKWFVAITSIIQMALINCSTPVITTIINDNIPKESRGKWASFDSIAGACWCVSAVLGGWICDEYGYNTAFTVTAIFHGVAIIVLTPILVRER